MAGEKNLDTLLKTMRPTQIAGDYVFCSVKDIKNMDVENIVLFFREEEGITIIIKKEVADFMQLPYTFVTSWITLKVHSSLEAVGFTAAFSKALTDEQISCNVVAGFYHDHIFVSKNDTEKAIQILTRFSRE